MSTINELMAIKAPEAKEVTLTNGTTLKVKPFTFAITNKMAAWEKQGLDADKQNKQMVKMAVVDPKLDDKVLDHIFENWTLSDTAELIDKIADATGMKDIAAKQAQAVKN